MSSATPPVRKRPGLPLWIKLFLLVGGLAALAGLVLTVVPFLILMWLMGSGDQVDTQALVSPTSLAVFHLEPDPEDPGVAAFLDHIAATLPEMQARVRQAQGYPSWLTRVETMRDARNTQAGLATMMPTQVTLVVEPSESGPSTSDDPSLLGAVNLPSWGRGARVGMWLGARMQDELADADPELRAIDRLEVDDNTLYVQQSSASEVFWGAIDSTLLGGAGSHLSMVRGMERLVLGQVQPMDPELQAAVDSLGGAGWEAWGAMVHQPQTVDIVWPVADAEQQLSAEQAAVLDQVVEGMVRDGSGALPEGFDPAALTPAEPPAGPSRSCLAELEGVLAVAFGLDVVGPDAIMGRLAVRGSADTNLDEADACLRQACADLEVELAEGGLALECTFERVERSVLTTGRLTGIEAATERFLEQMEAEAARARSESQARTLPPELRDLPELEGLDFE